LPRERGLPTALAAALAAAALLVPAPARADDPHGREAPDLLTLSDLTAAQRRLAEETFGRVICDCPNENWSKTLAMCPDGCALPQKQEILQQIRQGWTLDRMVEAQVQVRGPKVAAAPGVHRDGTWLVVAAVGAAAAVAGIVLLRWSRAAAERRAAAPPPPAAGPESEAIERELREID
jgi:hypothetical protein